MGRLIGRVIELGFELDSRLLRCPLYRWPRALILDTILGPADDFEFVPLAPPDQN